MRRIVIELASASLRVLSVDGTPRRPRLRVRVRPIQGELTGQVVREALAGLRLSRAEVVAVLPREQVITRLMELPATQPEELAQMVRLSGKAQFPYPPEQISLDFHVVEQRGGQSLVQLVACRRDVLDQYGALLRHAGCDPVAMVPSSWGLLAWYQRFGAGKTAREPALLVHVDAEHTELVVIRDGRLLWSRSLASGRSEWQRGLGDAVPLGEELDGSLAGLRKELPGVEPQTVLLTGLGELGRWADALTSRVGIPVLVKSMWGTMTPSGLGSGDSAASVAASLGLALASSWPVNLLPAEAQRAHRARRQRRRLMLVGGLALAVVLQGLAVAGLWVRRQEQVLARLQGSIHELEQVTDEARRIQDDVRRMERVLQSRRQVSTALSELFRLTPPEIVFERVVMERAREQLLVRGSAPSTRDVLDYLLQLKQSGGWSQVELRYASRRNTGTGSRTDFEIVLVSEPGDAS